MAEPTVMEMFIIPFGVVAFGYMGLFGVAYFRYQDLLKAHYPDSEYGQEGIDGRVILGWESDRKQRALEREIGASAPPDVVAARRVQDDDLWRITYAWLMAVVSFIVLVQAVNAAVLPSDEAWPYALLAGPLLVLSTEIALRARSLQGQGRVTHVAGAIIASPAVTLGLAIMFG